jgi:hypothetical protein
MVGMYIFHAFNNSTKSNQLLPNWARYYRTVTQVALFDHQGHNLISVKNWVTNDFFMMISICMINMHLDVL